MHSRQQKEDAQNEILKLRTQKTDLETQRDHDNRQSEFALNDARHQDGQCCGYVEPEPQGG